MELINWLQEISKVVLDKQDKHKRKKDSGGSRISQRIPNGGVPTCNLAKFLLKLKKLDREASLPLPPGLSLKAARDQPRSLN